MFKENDDYCLYTRTHYQRHEQSRYISMKCVWKIKTLNGSVDDVIISFSLDFTTYISTFLSIVIDSSSFILNYLLRVLFITCIVYYTTREIQSNIICVEEISISMNFWGKRKKNWKNLIFIANFFFFFLWINPVYFKSRFYGKQREEEKTGKRQNKRVRVNLTHVKI